MEQSAFDAVDCGITEPWSPGLVVMGGDSCSEGCGFKSQHRILDGHFFTDICCKNCNDVYLKRLKINEKEAGVGPFFLKKKKQKKTKTFHQEFGETL